MPELRPVHDPKLLRAIAHPVRNRILTELSATGSMRAADIARELDVPANQASFHLRQLAKYGLVEEDPAAARDKRDRVWRVISTDGYSVSLGEIERVPGGRAAAQVFRRNAAGWAHQVVDQAYRADRPTDAHRSVSDHALKLTKAEAKQLNQEMIDLVSSWADRTRGSDPKRRTYLLFSVLQPHPDLPRDKD